MINMRKNQLVKMFQHLLLTFCSILIIILHVNAAPKPTSKEWWKDSFIYQIYPRSFKDSNGDGVGDLNGITSKLEHFVDLNVSAIWISPIYVSPMADFGYDIANFTNVDPVFGTLDDFTNLTSKAKTLGIKVLLDFVPNHSSDVHPWFLNSIKKIKPYDDYYIWKDGRLINGTLYPPNNWLSVFGGSAWQYNSQRKQYYFHQFAIGQPDLNYRNPSLVTEMENVLTFWMNRGVDGFRMDAVNFLFEDPRFLDEPVIPNTGLPKDDYETLRHIYSKDLNDTYTIVKGWRKVIDAHGKKVKGDSKVILIEAYTSLSNIKQFYEAGANAPMNFIFFDPLNIKSTPLDYKKSIDEWMNNIPKGFTSNWVVSNHDNHRVATRYGSKRADQITMLSTILPGIAIVYYGDEIGMEDRDLTWEETVDPAGCNAGKSRYHLKSRDPERTPMQWDNTTNAGFSTANKTWLPVHSNYKTLNLAAQKKDKHSHYSLFKKLVSLKKMPIIENGSYEVHPIGNNNVLAVLRRLPDVPPVVLLINFSNSTVLIDACAWLNIPKQLTVFASSVGSLIPSEVLMDTTEINLPGSASVILTA